MRFSVRDFLAAFVLVAIPLLLMGWIAGLLPWPKFELAAFLPALAPLHLFYLVPIGLLVFGVRNRNAGIVGGVLAGGAALYLYVAIAMFAQSATIRDLESVADAPSSGKAPRMLVLSNGLECDALCIQVLANTGYQVALRDWDRWKIYRRVYGNACQQENAQRTVAMFVAAGYSGMCAVVTKSPSMPDGIVIGEYQLTGEGRRGDDVLLDTSDPTVVEHPWENELGPIKQIAERVPAFVGVMYERSVRIDGRQQLLERRFDGRLESSAEMITFSLAPGPISVGDAFERIAFYSRALDVVLVPRPRSGPVDLSASLDRLEKMMLAAAPPDSDLPGGDPRFALIGKYGTLAWSAEEPADIEAVRTRIERLLESDKPVLIHAALNAMGDSKRADPAEAEAALVGLLDRDNPDIVAIALRKADYQFHLANRPEIAKRLLEVPFRTELFQRDSALRPNGPSFPVFNPDGGYDDSYRGRAIDLLLSVHDMIPGHCEILLAIIARGGDESASKRDVLETLLKTDPPVFSACSAIFRARRSDLFLADQPTDAQLAILRDRAELVQPVALREYWRQFLSSEHARAMSDDHVLAIVRERLAREQQAHFLGKKALTQTQWLLGDLTKQ